MELAPSLFLYFLLHSPPMKRQLLIACIFLLMGLSSCVSAHSDDDDLRAVPVTNNPHVVPNYGSGFPMGAG